jgi:hypothetical protein
MINTSNIIIHHPREGGDPASASARLMTHMPPIGGARPPPARGGVFLLY